MKILHLLMVICLKEREREEKKRGEREREEKKRKRKDITQQPKLIDVNDKRKEWFRSLIYSLN